MNNREGRLKLNVHKMLMKLYVILQSELIYSNRYVFSFCAMFTFFFLSKPIAVFVEFLLYD